jgi:RimJ/RimL family protein N-acetyltransferase
MPRYLYGRAGRGGAWGASLRPVTGACRAVDPGDADSLGTLLWEAYRGTIDYRDETLDEMKAEARDFFDAKYGQPLLEASLVREVDGRPIAAALLCNWNERDAVVSGPLVAYALVHPGFRGQGHGIAVVNAALARLAAAKWGRVYAVITEGNVPSEQLFTRLGFERLPM